MAGTVVDTGDVVPKKKKKKQNWSLSFLVEETLSK